jgi:hypothetical protein
MRRSEFQARIIAAGLALPALDVFPAPKFGLPDRREEPTADIGLAHVPSTDWVVAAYRAS